MLCFDVKETGNRVKYVIPMNHRPFNFNSTSVAASMEGLGSSTTAVRNKRGDWLSQKRTGIIIKVVILLAAAALVTLAVITAVPIIRKTIANQKQVAQASTYHNFVKNDTSGTRNLLNNNS